MDEFKKISCIYNSLTGSGSQVIDVPHVAEVDCSLLYERISEKEGLSEDLFEITLNGKHLKRYSTCAISGKDGFQVLSLYSPLIAGKGGFGSMLRAIGAQIEKTTNKEACRDLSGRRLRDINAEKRIKEWISQRANRQEEEERKRKDKLLKLKEEPKLEFKDDEYFKVKEEIPEKVEEALNYGLKVVESAEKPAPVKKAVSNKGSLWIGVDLDESDEDDDVKEPSEGSQPENPEEPSTSGVKRTLNELPQPKRQKC